MNNVTLLNVTITNNVAGFDNRDGNGGGINNQGVLTMKNSLVAGNTDLGGVANKPRWSRVFRQQKDLF